jgi:pimeloyl-ACP methyl ester carboxylesterase
MKTVESADGTEIAYDSYGHGPSLVIVGGALNTRFSPMALVPALADHFTVYTYDRRGRGDSGGDPPFDRDREFEDLEAVIYAAGGAAGVYGHSSGAVLALETAARTDAVTRVVAYEPPYADGDPAGVQAVVDAIAAGDNEAAVTHFLAVAGVDTNGMKGQPWWPGMVAVAPTLPHEFALVDSSEVPVDRIATIGVPVLAIDGGRSAAWAAVVATRIADAAPHGRRLTIADQDHNVTPDAIAPVLIEFFRA